jgi:predicted site-specific integrase-resolvase
VSELVRVGDAATRPRVHADTLKRWERAGRLRPCRDQGGPSYPSEDVERLRRWREPKTVESGGERGDKQRR